MHLYKTMRRLPILAVTLAGFGCAPEPAHWSDIESPKVNTVEYTTMSYRVHFAAGAAALSKDEARALTDFASASLHAGDRVAVAVDRPERRRDSGLAARRESAIAKVLAKLSVDPVFDTARLDQVAPLPDEAILRVGRYVVTPPRCPDWSKPESDDFTNTPSSNFGCATTSNIGLMVADPADLVRGAGSGGGDAAFAARGVNLYRTGVISKSLAGTSESASGSSGGSGGGSGSGGGN